ncbi:MAG: hypothetical protein ACI9VR_001054 [Cognaticolwellia sp.]|jgi:hypothetical protein
MVSALSLPRDAWATHPKFPQQVLLLGSHASFRAISRRLIERLDRGASRANVLSTFTMWKAAMGGHESYEEHKLYPFLEHRWGLRTEGLSKGHDALAQADVVIRQAHGSELLAALEAHHDILIEHLDIEERTVIPALLALSADEFSLYSNSPLWLLLEELPCFQGTEGCSACIHRTTPFGV